MLMMAARLVAKFVEKALQGYIYHTASVSASYSIGRIGKIWYWRTLIFRPCMCDVGLGCLPYVSDIIGVSLTYTSLL